jgi:hypothetical protein
MWKIIVSSAAALLTAVGIAASSAAAQTPQPPAPTTQPRAAAPASRVDKPTRAARLRKHKSRYVSRHPKRRHAAAFKCFGYQWRPFPTRDPKGYFYTPPGGGIC